MRASLFLSISVCAFFPAVWQNTFSDDSIDLGKLSDFDNVIHEEVDYPTSRLPHRMTEQIISYQEGQDNIPVIPVIRINDSANSLSIMNPSFPGMTP